jgi:dTDP-4-amino-4,6-dideoxy-D-glucose transaminase
MAHVEEIAVFGGVPLFASPRPVGQLASPAIDAFLATLGARYAAGTRSSGATLVRALEARLAEYHEVDHCVAVANAGLGLMILMRHFAHGRTGTVIMPAFSYRGLPHFAQWAGLMPRFCDVDERTQALDPPVLRFRVCGRCDVWRRSAGTVRPLRSLQPARDQAPERLRRGLHHDE